MFSLLHLSILIFVNFQVFGHDGAHELNEENIQHFVRKKCEDSFQVSEPSRDDARQRSSRFLQLATPTFSQHARLLEVAPFASAISHFHTALSLKPIVPLQAPLQESSPLPTARDSKHHHHHTPSPAPAPAPREYVTRQQARHTIKPIRPASPSFPRRPHGPQLLSPPPSPHKESNNSSVPSSPRQRSSHTPPSYSKIPRSPQPGPTIPSSPPPVKWRQSPPPRRRSPSSPVVPKPSPAAHKPSSPPSVSPKPSSPTPPMEDCGAIVCLPPLTKTPFMSPCGCVHPIQVRIELTVPLYSLFPLISVLAANLAESTVLSPNQVEIVGANADSQDPDNSVVDVNLVPLDQGFDNLTALIIYEKFWKHEVVLNLTLFGNYSVLYVQYPGLPPSPPTQQTALGGQPGAPARENPVGVVVKTKGHKLGVGTIAVITLSAAIALVFILGALWFVLLKVGCCKGRRLVEAGPVVSARTKRSAALSSEMGSSTSISFTSSIAAYVSTARTFTFVELDRATGRFRSDNVIGEGGFGRVYSGVLEDGQKVAVKVLTRDNQHGGKEFIAEVEMLSRLHHRNLVKLIGICTEEHNRCLVYELIPNGSVESHLHGIDKETSTLDWEARMKIALGAARGLAYLHEDSNPRVIHRDFKASNILLENEFNPKVSDFGLAKAAPDEGSGHLSTRVMGTFGYVAPEYAMTGHLLVKSDVYSYGVVLLELLSGRKPVDMSQPPGQENLVTWARPLLTSREGLEVLVDPALRSNYPLDNLAKVAAIASMCVQPEVSHRPFMGEVVQALKLVYNDSDIHNGTGSSNGSQIEDSLAESETRADVGQGWMEQKEEETELPDNTSFVSIDYDSGPSHSHAAAGSVPSGPLSISVVLSTSARFFRRHSNSFRRHSLSGPLRSSKTWLQGYDTKKCMNRKGSISDDVTLSRQISSG
ncbi:hypothetical protein GOP47_0022313 [Adiantum capillus-veneris]|uniref:Protein kinase domain-containing protein n=1 Tax=Adiantum capillus-veneris TaxID=13818 RepID=A0A9D4UB31_ADICA|nr:hypothetical protein GOP47_0022313 [Adiantum capillus-veneris]